MTLNLTFMELNWKMYFTTMEILQYMMTVYQNIPEGRGNAIIPQRNAEICVLLELIHL